MDKEKKRKPKVWRTNKENRIVKFSLTNLREDLLFRLQTDQLYTLEECKILLKEILLRMNKEAEQELLNLLTLSQLRNEKFFPKPINKRYIGERGTIEGFNDPRHIHKMIYGNEEDEKDSDDEDEEEEGEDDEFDENGEHVKKKEKKRTVEKSKSKLYIIIRKINKYLVHIIDNALKQKKERLLLSATIIKELEDVQ